MCNILERIFLDKGTPFSKIKLAMVLGLLYFQWRYILYSINSFFLQAKEKKNHMVRSTRV